MVDFDYPPTSDSAADYQPGSADTRPAPPAPSEPELTPSGPADDDPAQEDAEALLTFEEGRVLGCLMEKERTTPDTYPLSLNSLTTACNQKTSRLPVTDLDDDQVAEAVEGLRDKRLVHRVDQAGARTVKYQHRSRDTLELQKDEAALICVLLLRGPQTPGELRTRTERLYGFASPAEVEEVLRDLMERTSPLVEIIPAAQGRKESRYHQLLCEYPVELPEGGAKAAPVYQGEPKVGVERVEALEARVAELEAKLASLNQEFNQLRELLD